MSDLDAVFRVDITRETSFPSQAGFGTPMFLAFHTLWPERLRVFDVASVISELDALSVPVHHPVYRACSKVAALRRKPQRIVIGRRALAPTMIVRLSPLVATEGHVYRFVVTDKNGLATVITRTVPAASSTTAEATAIAALIDPLLDITATASLGVITVTGIVGTFFELSELPPPAELRVEETTADPGLATDLAAIGQAAEQGSSALEFYGVALDIAGEAAAKALFAWCQANGRVCVVRSTNSEVADGAITTDLASDLITLAHDCGFVVYAQQGTATFRDLLALAVILSYDPGTYTAAYKTLEGDSADRLTSAQVTALRAKRASYYTSARSTPYLYDGRTPNGEFIDLRIASDLIAARIQERLFGVQKNAPKIPFTGLGIGVLAAAVEGVLLENTATETDPARALAGAEYDDQGNLLSEGPIVTAPALSATSPTDRANRDLRGLTFSARFAGAIHTARIEGKIGV
jgi:hypothetical protein